MEEFRGEVTVAGARASVEDERRVDGVGGGRQRQERLAGWRARRRTSGKAQVLEDAAGDAAVFDEGHDVHGAAATWADQNVDGEATFQERGPFEAARASWIAAVYHGFVMLPGGQENRMPSAQCSLVLSLTRCTCRRCSTIPSEVGRLGLLIR